MNLRKITEQEYQKMLELGLAHIGSMSRPIRTIRKRLAEHIQAFGMNEILALRTFINLCTTGERISFCWLRCRGNLTIPFIRKQIVRMNEELGFMADEKDEWVDGSQHFLQEFISSTAATCGLHTLVEVVIVRPLNHMLIVTAFGSTEPAHLVDMRTDG